MFLLVSTYPGCPGPKAVKRLCVCVCYFIVVLDLELWTAYEAGLSWVSDN